MGRLATVDSRLRVATTVEGKLMERPQIAGWNLAVRFLLEVVVLVSLGIAGWKLGSGVMSGVLAIGIPCTAATAWGVFNVPNDPSRSGEAPVAVNGRTRLILELLVLGSGAVALWYIGPPSLTVGFAALAVVQYATSLDRVRWLIEQ